MKGAKAFWHEDRSKTSVKRQGMDGSKSLGWRTAQKLFKDLGSRFKVFGIMDAKACGMKTV